AVLACNHTGYLDFALAGIAARRSDRLVRFMAKSGVFEIPLVGAAMRAMRHVPVDRLQGAGAYRQASRELERGEVVGVFPEATISRSWTLKPFQPGAAALARAHGVPLVPVVVWGGHRVLTVDGRRATRRGVPVTVLVGEPFVPAPGDDLAAVSAELRARMQALLERAQGEYPDPPRDGDDPWWLPHALGGTAPEPAEAARLDAEALDRLAARTARTAARRDRRRRARSHSRRRRSQ
ncbi:lysophospholipid acyltransferase family protein, partial [Solicola sp. PLA-1-18]|uniref:lysophospholipid acyltransferase family protein n=1 Tax=Solicola sp. PLA-1-18 TaxID=3380532 RepID=UPI003B7717AD